MGLFRRKPRQSDPTGSAEPDPDLPLSIGEAARLRALVRRTFAEIGVEVVVRADHVTDDQGRGFGLWNLAAMCGQEPPEEWPALVARHVEYLRSPTPSLADLPEDELRHLTCLRLVEASSVPADWHPSASRIGDSLLPLLAVDLPTAVLVPREEAWEAHGGTGRWHGIGQANLRALLVSDDLRHEVFGTGGDGGDFEVVMGDSFFTASIALLGEEVVQRFTPGVDTGRGLLVAVPFRHQVAWRVVDGPGAAVALDHLFRFAMLGYADSPGPLAPHVYWVRRGEWRQVTDLSGEEPSVVVDEELAEALGL